MFDLGFFIVMSIPVGLLLGMFATFLFDGNMDRPLRSEATCLVAAGLALGIIHIFPSVTMHNKIVDDWGSVAFVLCACIACGAAIGMLLRGLLWLDDYCDKRKLCSC